MRLCRRCLAALTLVVLLSAPAGGAPLASEARKPESEPSRADIAGDVLMARPLRAIRLVMGAIIFPIARPSAKLLGDGDWAMDVCLRDPAADLVDPSLGDF
jgi:hypothetical protein